MTVHAIFLILSNVAALALGYIFGHIFRWKRVVTPRGTVIAPWVGRIRGHDAIILLLAGIAMLSTYSMVLDNQRQERHLAEQYRCNVELEEAITLREQSAKRYVMIIDGLVDELAEAVASGGLGPDEVSRQRLGEALGHYQEAFDQYMSERPELYNRDPDC